MNQMITYIIIIFAIYIVLFQLGTNIHQKILDRLNKLIEDENGYLMYEKELNRIICKIFISKKQRELLLLNASLRYGQYNNLENIFLRLENQKLNSIQKMYYYQAKIDYDIHNNRVDQAKETLTKLQTESEKSKNPIINGVYRECRYRIFVDTLQDLSFISEIEESIPKLKDSTLKGIFLLRLGKLYKKNKNYDDAKKSLKEAKELLRNTYLENEVLKELW